MWDRGKKAQKGALPMRDTTSRNETVLSRCGRGAKMPKKVPSRCGTRPRKTKQCSPDAGRSSKKSLHLLHFSNRIAADKYLGVSPINYGYRILHHPLLMTKIKEHIWQIIFFILGYVSPKTLASIHFRRSFGRWMDWKNPTDINEKIQWLKFHSDTTLWTPFADKFLVRQHIKDCGLEDMLVRLYGKWDHAEDIDWDTLPNQFVMKTNHGSGDALICRDKNALDKTYWTEYFGKLLTKQFGRIMGEPHYNKIKPCIIAEELLDNRQQQVASTSLVDYKIWTFRGTPAYIWACHNRTKEACEVGVYDLNWKMHPEYSRSTSHYLLSEQPIPRPASLDRMLKAASILSKDFPELRIDFYEVNGKPYFGEMTFTSAAGLNSFYTQEFLNILGDLCHIK